MSQELETWLKDTSNTLRVEWGLDKSFSTNAALLFLYLWHYGLNPVITSGWRSPQRQAELMKRYQAGDPSIRFKPAKYSKHMNTSWLGGPASLAIDISTSNPRMAAQIAKALNVRPGYDFNDPVHFYI